jgi:anti-sigma factor RsiW
MNHADAVETRAAERYVLDEMTPEEREQFEEHYFGCAACAADVRDEMTIAATLRAENAHDNVVPIRRTSPVPWLAAAAMLAIVAFLGYQNAMLRARSPHDLPRVLHTVSLSQESRGGGEETVVGNASQPFGLFIDIPPRANATRYVVTIADSAGRARETVQVPREEARESVQLVVPGGLLSPGHYSVTARSEPAVGPDSVWSFVVR